MPKNGVLPSFWDRLHGNGNNQRSGKTVAVEEFERAVVRDVENLLNERSAAGRCVPEQLRGTILSYGLPELTAFDLSSQSGAEKLALAIENAIRAFEPRLENVSVAAVLEEGRERIFRIRADIRITPAIERVQFQATVSVDTSRVNLGSVDRLTGHDA